MLRESNQPEACACDRGQTIIGFVEPLLLFVDSYGVDGLAVRVRSFRRKRHDFPIGGKRCLRRSRVSSALYTTPIPPLSFATIGVGLRGMSERVSQLGGILEIHSSGNGTRVTVELPAMHPFTAS